MFSKTSPARRDLSARPPVRLRAGAAFVALAAGLSACAADVEPAPEQGGFDLTVGALSQCGGTSKSPFPDIKTMQLVVRKRGAGGTYTDEHKATAALGAGATSISFTEVPAGSPYEVTLVGYGAGSSPLWYARKTGVNIKKNQKTPLDMTLMAVEAFTCIGRNDMPNALMPAAVNIAEGKVLITGGFSNAAKVDVTGTQYVQLESPLDRAYIFDPNTGNFRVTKGLMKAARAGHSMIYLPNTNRVLIVGGAQKMKMKADGTEPPLWSPTEAVSKTFEIYDVAKDEFLDADGQEWAQKRVLPNLVLLADDFVASCGGAPWPKLGDPKYASCDIYNPKIGQFYDSKEALRLNGVRAGAAVAYIGPTDNGTSKYLFWGGNVLSEQGVGAKIAERLKESTELGTSEFRDDFKIEGDLVGKGGTLLFPTLTHLGPGKSPDEDRFLSVGGIRFQDGKWQAPNTDEAWLITLKEPTANTIGRITTKRVSGLTKGIYLHQANPAGVDLVVFSGGFSQFGKTDGTSLQGYDIKAEKLLAANLLSASKDFVVRGGHAGLTLRNDCVLMFGGAAELSDAGLKSSNLATSDVYCPKRLVP